MYSAYDRKKSKDDDEYGWNDNYEGDDDYINEIDEKMIKNTQILWLLSKNELILGPITLWNKGRQIQAGAPPPGGAPQQAFLSQSICEQSTFSDFYWPSPHMLHMPMASPTFET